MHSDTKIWTHYKRNHQYCIIMFLRGYENAYFIWKGVSSFNDTSLRSGIITFPRSAISRRFVPVESLQLCQEGSPPPPPTTPKPPHDPFLHHSFTLKAISTVRPPTHPLVFTPLCPNPALAFIKCISRLTPFYFLCQLCIQPRQHHCYSHS